MLSAGKAHELYFNKDVGICWECLDFSSNMLDPKLALHEASLLPQETWETHCRHEGYYHNYSSERRFRLNRPLSKGIGYLWAQGANTVASFPEAGPHFPRDPAITCQLQGEAKADKLVSPGILSSLAAPLGPETGQVPGSVDTGKVLRPPPPSKRQRLKDPGHIPGLPQTWSLCHHCHHTCCVDSWAALTLACQNIQLYTYVRGQGKERSLCLENHRDHCSIPQSPGHHGNRYHRKNSDSLPLIIPHFHQTICTIFPSVLQDSPW